MRDTERIKGFDEFLTDEIIKQEKIINDALTWNEKKWKALDRVEILREIRMRYRQVFRGKM